MTFRHRDQKPRRLDQSVTGVLARLAALTIASMVVLTLSIAWRTVIYQATTTFVDASEALQLAHAGMLDQETGLRGYLAAHDSALLQTYTQGESELTQGNSSLQKLVDAEPDAFTPMLNLRLAEQSWLTQWAGPALQGVPPAQLDLFLQQGKSLFDAYRGTESDVHVVLAARIAQLEVESNSLSIAALGLEGLLLIVGALVWWRSRRQLRTWIVAPVTAILGTLKRFESGNYAAPEVPDHGPSELQSVGLRLTSLGDVLESARAAALATSREAAEHAERLRMVVDLSRELTGSLNLHYVLGAVSTSVLRLGIGTRCIVWLTDDAGHTLVPMFDSAGVKGRIDGLEPLQLGEELVGKAARYGRVTGPGPVSHPLVDQPWSVATAIPMIVGARVIGVIEAGAAGPVELPEKLVEVIDTISSQAATAIEAARLYERAEHIGRTDVLTQLPNRLELDRDLAAEVSRAARYKRPLSIAMLDLDDFKSVNDTYGHARGDEILQHAAAVMRGAVRETDTIYRYGGEEFLLVMPETDGAAALRLCDRLRAAMAEQVATPDGVAFHVTVSCGVAAFPGDGEDAGRLVKAADRAMYGAKREGRNQVRSASDEHAGDIPYVGPLIAPAV